MSKQLLLLRHAQSAEKQPGQADHERILTTEGTQELQSIKKFFNDDNFFPEIVLCSSSTRTKQTATIIFEGIENSSAIIQYESDLYSGSIEEYLHHIQQLNNSIQTVLIIGHNPTVSFLTEHLTNSSSINMVPGELIVIHFDVTNWGNVLQNSGVIKKRIKPHPIS